MQGRMREIIGLQQNIVALCDVDEDRILESQRSGGDALAGARTYKDYRALLESEKNLDAVVIATPDHWHAPICRAAMLAGKHVYCEKPLTHTVADARELRELARRSNLVTQTGNQGSASANLRRCIELIQAGLFGQIREVHAWHPAHGWPSGVDRPASEDPIPEGLDWDFWLGTAPMRPYKADLYHLANWRGWYDFGSGSLGDFCCHMFNLPVRALKLEYPTHIAVTGTGMGRESFPTACTVRYSFERRNDLDPLSLFFYTGGPLPPTEVTQSLRTADQEVPAHGCVLVGDNGSLSVGLWNSGGLMKLKEDREFTSVSDHEAAQSVPITLPRVDGHMKEWIDACQGGPKTFSDFEIGGHITEIGLAGIVALRLGHDIAWDGPGIRVHGTPEADVLIQPVRREKWLV